MNKLIHLKKLIYIGIKIVDTEDKLENLINAHNDKFNEEAKQDFIDKLKGIYRKKDMKDAFKSGKM